MHLEPVGRLVGEGPSIKDGSLSLCLVLARSLFPSLSLAITRQCFRLGLTAWSRCFRERAQAWIERTGARSFSYLESCALMRLSVHNPQRPHPCLLCFVCYGRIETHSPASSQKKEESFHSCLALWFMPVLQMQRDR